MEFTFLLIQEWNFLEDGIKIIISGLDNAGKTSILTALQKKFDFEKEIIALKPTIKVEYHSSKFLGNSIHLWDMGGQQIYRELYIKPSELRTYDYYTKSAGIFIDAGGVDNYWIKNDSTTPASEKYKNNRTWFDPEKADSNYGYNNYGIGIDRENGYIPELEIFDPEGK